MKKLRLLPLAIALIAIIGCDLIDKVKDASTIPIDAEIFRRIYVNISENDDDKLVDEPFQILAQDNPDIAEYLADINTIDVNRVYITIEDYQGDPSITFTGSISMVNGRVNIPLTTVQPSEYTGMKVLELTLSNASLLILNEAMTENWAISGNISGTVSDKPVSFTIVIWVEVTAEAEV